MALQQPIEMYEFIDKFTKDKHLTIGDLLSMKNGDTREVVIWDRNFSEKWIFDYAINLKHYKPEEFFLKNKHKIVYKGDMTWDIHFNDGFMSNHPVHLDVTSLDTFYHWVPLDENDGKIHITDEILPVGVDAIPAHWKAKHIHWKDFANTTRVGFRGPIMLWKDLKDMPMVYYHDTYSTNLNSN